MSRARFDLRTFLLLIGAASIGAAWAIYNRSTTSFPYDEPQLRALIWTIFATPFALFWGWFVARPGERWLAAFTCFCVYFFTPFVAARYETCTVVYGSFNLVSCFVDTEQAQQQAGEIGHRIYFDSVVVIQFLAALGVALQRALARPAPANPPPQPEAEPA
jgi:hypothetical protein